LREKVCGRIGFGEKIGDKMRKLSIRRKIRTYCNMCGKEIGSKENKYEAVAVIKVEWGYFSEKDGEIHKIRLCEKCYDSWVEKFALPVEIEIKKELLN